MFWEIFVALCNEKGTSPSAVCKEVGLSNATATHWKKGAQPGSYALKKLSDYFGVPVNYFDEKKEAATILTPNTAIGALSQHEINLILRYRQMTDMQSAVDKLLGLPDGDEPLIPVYVAAHSENNAPDRIEYLTREEAERLKNAPAADFDF